ncbi:MAG: hypothetical protein KDC73_13605 [Ignavibacteriae bacterium]|nr:hypothetical protein [Ignavibacteriota bacterium]MCB9244689.1 hypothetical protein [Ignavibacteriales bacterium]
MVKKKNYTKVIIASFLVFLGIYLSGCVNVDQDTKLNADGSGTINLHYWTKMSNVSSSDEIGGFAFSEDKAKSNYTSSNSEVKSVNISDDLEDSTKHVKLEITFKDINALPSAKGFEKVTTSWKEGSDGMDFNYTLKQDTSNAKNMGASDTKLTYKFEFPGEVISTNGRKDGQTVEWDKTLADLKEDVEMTATVKKEGGKCGLFGLELPVLVMAGMIFLYGYRRKKK